MNIVKLLGEYNERQQTISVNKSQLEYLEKIKVKSSSLSSDSGSKKVSISEQYELLMTKKEDLKIIIAQDELINLTIDLSLNELESIEQELAKILRFKYIVGYKHEKIAKEVHLHPRTITRKHKIAINKLSTIMERVWLDDVTIKNLINVV
ncbi:RNA polymerase sigma factor [Turicibacter sanguinis]|nr:RNA polymerase sigma factor [Turicibacter sanguinis]